ncbi:EamA family transporter [Actinomadura verrucosospora]|uniref:Integral membrane protein n=1 Tax=Actinomadura verrucosospora TaxID=46165 RepID=A0A7D3ZSQ5_ACTVE|nr:EamA family transporter [Actinomadura verrucosospora]QKG26803.1 integral membrane protein [Actinomadura verrucosospora]
MTVALAVIFAGVLHATWNAIVKGAPDRWASFALVGFGEALVAVPLGLAAGPPDRAAWPWLAASVVVHTVYMGLLLAAYQLGDFSQVYPLARGSAPLLVAVLAAVALGERLSWTQDAGVAAVCGGLGVLAFAGRRGGGTADLTEGGAARERDPRAVAAALLTGVSIASYTLLDGVGVRHAGGSLSYTSWMFGIQAPLTVAIVLAVRGRTVLTRQDRPAVLRGLAGGLISMASYGIVLWAQTRGALASVAALRETGVISGAVIGAVFFSERLGPRRIAAACVVAAGVVLITAH